MSHLEVCFCTNYAVWEYTYGVTFFFFIEIWDVGKVSLCKIKSE